MTKVGCCLVAAHRIPEGPPWDWPLDTPEGLAKAKEDSDRYDRARIVIIYISVTQAVKIIRRLWPKESLLGATCGQTFRIETANEVSVINEILAPKVWINSSEDHKWLLHTWPE
jgi:hypothetical protein